MAVEIPVYVDIQGAFDRAVKAIPQEMTKLEKVLSRHALNMKIDMGGGATNSIRNLLTDTTMSASDLEFALKRVRKAFNEAVAKDANKTKTSATVNNLAKAYGLLEQRVKGFYNSNNVAAMRLEDTIAKVSFKINQMKTQLSTLPRGSEQYNKINYELQIQRQRLAELTAQQMKYKAGIDASTSAYHKQAGIVKQLAGYFSGLYAAHSLIRFVKQVRDVTGELEYQRVALGHLLQDEQFGNELFAKTIEAAKESPFRIGQLVTYTKQLAAYRIEQENLFDTTQRLADISAGLGVDMNRLILAYGQVRAASVLRGQELRQFTEAGIPLVELLAEKFRQLGREGTTTADVFKLISERAVPFEYIKEIFEDLTNAGGQFYKMQETQAKTLQGRWEKLKDAYDQALMRVGETETFQNINDTVLSVLNKIANNLTGLVRVVNAGAIAWAAYWVATKTGLSYGVRLTGMFIKEYGVVKTLTFGVAGLTAAFKRLWLAMKANWVGLALSAVAGLITYFTTFKNKTDKATEGMSELQAAIEKMKRANEEFAYGKGLIATYQELADKTNKTAAENKRLAITMEELERLYPSLAVEIHYSNIPLEERIGLLDKAAEAEHNYAIEEAKERLLTQQGVIRSLEDQEKTARSQKEAAEQVRRRWEEEEEIQRLREKAAGVEPGSTRYSKELAKNTADAAVAAKEAEDAYDKIAMELTAARKEAEKLRKLVFPEDVTNSLQQWAQEIKDLQASMRKPGDSLVFTDEDLKNFTSVYDLSKKLKNKIDDLTTSIAGMKSEYKNMAPEKQAAAAGQALSGEIADAEKLLKMAEAIRIALGLDFSKKTGSDKRLSNLKKDISDITNAYKKFVELSKYMSKSQALEAIGKLFPQLKGFEPTLDNTINRLKDLLKNYKGPKDAVYLDMQKAIDTEISNLNFDALKLALDNKLKDVSEDIRRSETIRNFYKNILEATGDEQLAQNLTISVYGDLGKDFRTKLQEEMMKAISDLKETDISDKDKLDFLGDITVFDIDSIRRNLDKLPPKTKELFQNLLAQNEDFSAKWEENFINTYRKAYTYQQRITTLENRRKTAIQEAQDRGKSPEEIAAVTAYWNKQIAGVQLEAMKDTYTWTKAFEDLEGVSNRTLNNLIDLIDKYITKYGKDLEPQQLKEITRARENAKAQLLSRNAFKSAGDAMYRYVATMMTMRRLQIAGKENTKEYTQALDDQQRAIADLSESFNELQSELGEVVSSAKDLMNVFASDKDAAYFSEQMDNLTKTISGVAKAGIGIAQIAAGNVTPQAILQTVTGIADVITGIFGASNAAKMRGLNDQIKAQERALNDLERAYKRLGDLLDETFGSDHIAYQTQQIQVLQAKVAAYNAQLQAEQAKGKKASKDAIDGYKNSIWDTTQEIEKLKKQQAEWLSGSDVTSAAEAFTDAWLNAYKEYGNTAGAIEERMQEMVENIVKKAALAGVVQKVLQPWYDQINAMQAQDLTPARIAELINNAMALVPTINDGLKVAANSLQSAGVNLRGSVGSATGISRNIAGASEESINGLAQGINTQNFYISHVPTISQNVAAILAIMSGSGENAGAVSPVVVQVPQYMQYLPNIDANVAEMRAMLKSVISPKASATATHYVAVK